MALDLQGRVCLITGASQGIGAAIVTGFSKRGATVIATDIIAPSHETAVLNLAWDVTDAVRGNEVVAEIEEQFGKLDALIANAGYYPREHWDEITPARWREILSINLDGAWHACQSAARLMVKRGYGKIVTVSSIEVRMGVPQHTHYDAAKAGVIGLTRSFARALGPDGIRVNCLMPGAVLTESEIKSFPDQEAAKRLCAQNQCLPERLLPEMVEPVFAWLCSEESDAITGQVICADHGWIHY